LIGVVIGVVENSAIESDENPDLILARALYVANKRVHEMGTDSYLERLVNHYPLLKEAIS
jgi:hypothetical protein